MSAATAASPAADSASPAAEATAPAGGFARAMEKAARRLAAVTAAHRPAAKDGESGVARKLDLAKTSSMDVEALNTLVVQLRKFVRMAKVRTIHKLARAIKKLRTRKGTEEQSAKNTAKAEKLAEEIVVMKAANIDRISKFALSNTLTLSDVHKQKQPSAHLRALTRLAEHESLQERVQRWRSEHADWEELGAFLLSKNTGRRFRKKKVKATAVTKELNRTLLKETIKKAAKEVGAAPGDADLVDAVEPTTHSPRGLCQEGREDDASSSSSSSLAGDAPAESGGDDSGSGSHAAPPDATSICTSDDTSICTSDDDQSAEPAPSAPAKSSPSARAPIPKSEEAAPRQQQRQQQQRKETRGGRPAALSSTAGLLLPVGGCGEDEPKKRRRGGNSEEDAAATAAVALPVRSAEMVVARIDLSAAGCSGSGCIAVPTVTSAADEVAAAAGGRDGEASSHDSAPAAVAAAKKKKKKSLFFMRGDSDDERDDVADDDGGDDDGGEAGSDGGSTDDSDAGEEGRSTPATQRRRSAPDRSVFVSSLHGPRAGSCDQRGCATARSFTNRGGSQASSRFSKNVGASWPRAAKSDYDDSGRHRRGPDYKGRPPPPPFGRGSAGRGSTRHPVARPAAGLRRLNNEPAKPAEKLHPSWEASKKRKAMEKLASQPFCGKKIKFDDD